MKAFAAGTVPAGVIIIGKRAAIFRCAVDHGAIAGKIGLARQDVHGLRAGDPRHQLHGEGGDTRIRQRLERIVVAVGIHERDDNRALLVVEEFVGAGTPHTQDDIGVPDRVFRQRGAGGFVFRIGNARFQPGARLDGDLGTKPDQLFDGLRRTRNTRLGLIGLRSNRDFHLAPRPRS